MEKNSVLDKDVRIHFIGVGGIGMSALAEYCLSLDMKVSGSDVRESEQTRRLQTLGAKIFLGHRRLNAKGADVVVYTSAAASDNPELLFAEDNDKLILKRSELLALIEKKHGYSIAVSGCHGKTTTTAMIAHIYKRAGIDLTAFIGGEDKVYGNFIRGKDIMLAEACEFKRNFLDLSPSLALVLNIDDDHLDCYRDMFALTEAYRKFIDKCVAVINADDVRAAAIAGESSVTFGIKNTAIYMAKNIVETAEGIEFDFYEYGAETAHVQLALSGSYNVYNALAALACTRYYGISVNKAVEALKNFTGVKRRRERLADGVIADYAHHPREIAAVMKGEKNAIAVFQPHTYSRTRLLMNEFVEVLAPLRCVILPTYAAREAYDVDGSGYALYLRLKECGADALYAEDEEKLFALLAHENAEKIIFIGAGDIYDYALDYVKRRTS